MSLSVFDLSSNDRIFWNENYKNFVAQRDTVNDLILFLTAMETNQSYDKTNTPVDFVNE
ncbi:hypothetical protein HYE22_00820 [Mycoplasmopsis bovis]|nr:hypothetical protein [Mycoplasmopsis bovis]QQH24054.1 hypothetical protein HYE22_00820 [Mycoplasmopsis bovis]